MGSHGPSAFSDRGTLTQPERTNQSYWRRLSDQDNNHVIERERESETKRGEKSHFFKRREMTGLLQMAHCGG